MTTSKDEAQNGSNYRATLMDAVLDEATFLGLTFSHNRDLSASSWTRLRLRPVEVRGRRHIQFSFFDGTRDITKNYAGPSVRTQLGAALDLPFARIDAQTTDGDLQVRITKGGKVRIARGKPSRCERVPSLAHDRSKARLVRPDNARKLLRIIGITSEHGEIRPGKRAKFRQVNAFLRILEAMVSRNGLAKGPLHIVDCGCGSARLTMAVYYYLKHLRGIDAGLEGVDINGAVIDDARAMAQALGWHGLAFNVAPIKDFVPAVRPDIVLSLHACDTATDEAIAQGIRWDSQVILAAPCCQHELHHQLDDALFRPVLRHGILRERQAEILTDALRALILRIMGYRSHIVEFVSPEHTSKNLMLQAERGLVAGDRTFVKEYLAMKDYWRVSLTLEELLGKALQRHLRQEQGVAPIAEGHLGDDPASREAP